MWRASSSIGGHPRGRPRRIDVHDRDAGDPCRRIEVAAHVVDDLDRRLGQIDAIETTAKRGKTGTALAGQSSVGGKPVRGSLVSETRRRASRPSRRNALRWRLKDGRPGPRRAHAIRRRAAGRLYRFERAIRPHGSVLRSARHRANGCEFACRCFGGEGARQRYARQRLVASATPPAKRLSTRSNAAAWSCGYRVGLSYQRVFERWIQPSAGRFL
jgi:hypothetical protein